MSQRRRKEHPDAGKEAKRRWNAKNCEKVREHRRAWYHRHKEERAEYHRRWLADNKEQQKAHDRAYYQANRAGIIAKVAAYQVNNVSAVRRYKKQNNMNRRSAVGKCSLEQWEQRCKYYDFKCRYCGVTLDTAQLTIDHAIPISRGGSNWPANLIPACSPCNLAKSSLTIFEYLRFLRKTQDDSK